MRKGQPQEPGPRPSGLITVRGPRLGPADLVVAGAVVVLFYVVARVGRETAVSFSPAEGTHLSTDPSELPHYAARSVLRMFAALGLSIAFTLAFGYAAAHSRRLERLLIPALDILQSVPVLVFLSVTVTGFLALFPGSLLGLECASVFAIFTAQAWNIAFAFYHSIITLPRELDELSRSLRLTRWMRFWRVEVPAGTIPMVWNGMMSFGGSWFFLVASEAIAVGGTDYPLPGVGSYGGAALEEGDLGKVVLAFLTMAVLVIGVNFLFWRPLTAWAERFKTEQTEAVLPQRSAVLDLLRRAGLPRLLGRALAPVGEAATRAGRIFGVDDRPLAPHPVRRRVGDAVFTAVAVLLIGWGVFALLAYVHREAGLGAFGEPLLLGLATLARVAAVIVFSTLVWVPVGVWIGFSARRTRIAQPIVQVLASFPANFLFPLALWVFVETGLSINVGGVALMALGAQWYILFNTIAGAMAVPTDLREAMDDLGVRGRLRWRRLVIPAIFPSYVTGGITASGGAWNASIVAEVVTFGGATLTAVGLGAYISEASASADLVREVTGTIVMSLYVIVFNRLLWRRLYRLAETRYAL
ncbi:ABC transporter permease [Spirillospora sp. CA-253888]